ncbi:MAG: glycosyltransferase [Candidatus Taylorbacteria bacterium]|nr:glycosyltransferase [Candidatus Taylorbacteria bacterium]
MNYSDVPTYFFLFVGLYFQIFLLVTFFEKEEEKYPELPKGLAYPRVAITVPCFNEEKTLTKTVLSLRALDYPKEKLEILIIDDGSTDNTYAVAQELVRTYPEVKFIHQKNGGKHTAVNLGITSTTADFVACLDADSEVAPNALKIMLPLFADPKVAAVTPAIRVQNPENLIQTVQRTEYNIGIFTKRIFGRLNAIHVTPGPFSVFRREIFSTIGLFKKAHNTEDMEIALRIQSYGYTIENCHKAYVYTVTPPTIKRLHTQRVRWIAGFMKNAIDYRHLFFNKKIGHMATFTLPFATLSILGSLYFIISFLIRFGERIYNSIEKMSVVGFDFNILPRHIFDWFFLDTATSSFIGMLIITITIAIICIGKYFAEGTMKPSRDMLYFLVVYGVIAPFWFSKALYNTALSRKTPWR